MFFDDFFTDSIPWDENHHENPTIWENIFWFTFSIRIEESQIQADFKGNQNLLDP